jgi:hypothetical protein
MHGSINVKSPNNTSKWQMGFNSAFKGLNLRLYKQVLLFGLNFVVVILHVGGYLYAKH